MGIAIALHVLAAVIWIGGMFFAVYVQRPAAGALEADVRVALWGRALGRFLPAVWALVAVILGTGYWMVFAAYGGLAGLPIYLKLMHGIGWIMVLLFLHLWFAPYRRFRAALAARGLTGRVRANKAQCLDQCEHGPTVVVYPEQVWYGFVRPEDVEEIVDQHIVSFRQRNRHRAFGRHRTFYKDHRAGLLCMRGCGQQQRQQQRGSRENAQARCIHLPVQRNISPYSVRSYSYNGISDSLST